VPNRPNQTSDVGGFYRSVTGASIITARQSQFGGVCAGGTGSKLIFATGALACTPLLQTHTQLNESQTRLVLVVSGGRYSVVPWRFIVEGCMLTLYYIFIRHYYIIARDSVALVTASSL